MTDPVTHLKKKKAAKGLTVLLAAALPALLTHCEAQSALKRQEVSALADVTKAYNALADRVRDLQVEVGILRGIDAVTFDHAYSDGDGIADPPEPLALTAPVLPFGTRNMVHAAKPPVAVSVEPMRPIYDPPPDIGVLLSAPSK